MVLKQKFQHQPTAIASFNYVDIADGTGVTTFYGASVSGSHILTQNTIYADDIISSTTAIVDAGWTKKLDIDFDLTAFNTARDIKGTAYFNVPFAVQSEADSTTHTVYIWMKVRKWDGTAETLIGEMSGSPVQSPGSAGGVATKVDAIPVVLEQTHFQDGDVLRVTTELWASGGAGGHTGTAELGHDPQNRDGTMLTPSSAEVITQLINYIPCRIDL